MNVWRAQSLKEEVLSLAEEHCQVLFLAHMSWFPKVHLHTLQNQSQSHHPYVAEAEEEIGDFLSHHMEEKLKSSRNRKIHLPKFAPPQTFDGTMKDTKSFISSIILYIEGHKPEFHTTESKIMFVLSYMQGGKAQFWRNKAINQIVMGHEDLRVSKILLKSKGDSSRKVEDHM